MILTRYNKDRKIMEIHDIAEPVVKLHEAMPVIQCMSKYECLDFRFSRHLLYFTQAYRAMLN